MATIFVTNKDNLPKRKANDVYETEHTLINTAIREYGTLNACKILDVGAGDGRWGGIAAWYNQANILHGVDIRNLPKPLNYDGWWTEDFLTWNSPHKYDLIVSNPPYIYAEKIIRRAWSLLTPMGTMIFLLSIDFMSSEGRYNGLWYHIPPVEVGVLSRRPSFYGGGTNGTNYGLYVFHSDSNGKSMGHPRRWRTRLIMYERV